jgi:hypothetical protein
MPARSFFRVFHALPGALDADGAAQLFGFASGELATIMAMRSSCS